MVLGWPYLWFFWAIWFGKTMINSFWTEATFLSEILWSGTWSYAPLYMFHSNKGVIDWELRVAVQLFPHKSFIWMKGDCSCWNHSSEWHQKYDRQMDVNVTAVKGPYEKTGIKANLSYFSCIALFSLNELGTWWSDGNIISNCKVIMHNCQSCRVLPAGGLAAGILHLPK